MEQEQIASVQLTPAAITAVRELMEKRGLKDYGLRVFVSGMGCSGLQYGMALDNQPGEKDITTLFDGVKLIVDDVSMSYMGGSTIDFINTENGAGFRVENPNSAFGCGCGSASNSQSGGCSGCG